MKRLLLCTAPILVLTASANAQWIMGSGNSPSTHAAGSLNMPNPYPSTGCWTAYGCALLKQQARVQRNKQPRR